MAACAEVGKLARCPQDAVVTCCCWTLLVQDIFNLLPNMNVETLSTSLAVKGNDMMATIYLASLIRSILALHKLIDNKEQRMWTVSMRGCDHITGCPVPTMACNA